MNALKRKTTICGICTISVTCCIFFALFGTVEAAKTVQDGQYYFNELKKSMLYVMKQQQTIINMNPDGSVKNKKLLPEAFYKTIYAQFKQMSAGKNFQPGSLKGVNDPGKIATVLASLLQAGRLVTARSQKIINAEDDGTMRMKKFIPAVFGKLTMVRFTGKTDSYMKQTTLGKGKYKQRNYDNQPNSWETVALEKFNQPGCKRYYSHSELVTNTYHYVRPIYIQKSCLPCHGLPIGEDDPYGHPREGYKQGEVRGGISVALPVY